jgi:alpha-beta hydrolase superfamily lysophospholipase
MNTSVPARPTWRTALGHPMNPHTEGTESHVHDPGPTVTFDANRRYASVNPEADLAVGELGGGFVAETAGVNGTAIHYVRGGRGPTVVLLHGFPQDWYAWRRIMPRLSKRFTVVAVDLRGVGGSAPSADGYAAVDLARDVHQLIGGLKLGPAHLVGHDIGGCVAYAFARGRPANDLLPLLLQSIHHR